MRVRKTLLRNWTYRSQHNTRKEDMAQTIFKNNLIAATLAVVALTGIAWAEEPTTDEMATMIEQLQNEVAELKAADSGSPANADEKWTKTFGKVDIHGYVSQGYLQTSDNNYLYSDTEDGSFQFNEAAINVYTEITPKLSVGIQLFARDLGAVGNNAIQLDYAFGDYRFDDAFGLRAGRIRIPWGLYGDIRDIDMARTNILMPQSVYSETQRDVAYGMNGFGVYGHFPLGSGGIEYQAQVGSNTIDDNNTAIGWISFGNAYTEPDWTSDHGTIITGRLIWDTPLNGFRVGGSYFTLDEVTFTSKTTNDETMVNVFGIPAGSDYSMVLTDVVWWTGFAEYATGDLVLAAEYVAFENTLEDTIWAAAYGIPKLTTPGDGYYLSGRYRFTDLFELGAYYSRYWSNKNDRKGEGNAAYGTPDYNAWSNDLALSLRFDVYEGLIWKVEGHYMDGTANLYANVTDTATAEKNWYLFATKLSFTF